MSTNAIELHSMLFCPGCLLFIFLQFSKVILEDHPVFSTLVTSFRCLVFCSSMRLCSNKTPSFASGWVCGIRSHDSVLGNFFLIPPVRDDKEPTMVIGWHVHVAQQKVLRCGSGEWLGLAYYSCAWMKSKSPEQCSLYVFHPFISHFD